MEVPRREPGNQTYQEQGIPFSFPGSRLGTHGARGSASASGGACKSWRFPGGSLGTRQFWWLAPFSSPVHHSRSQAPAWERTAPEAPPRFQAEPVNQGGSQAGAWEPDKGTPDAHRRLCRPYRGFGNLVLKFPGLTPWAIIYRPSGTRTARLQKAQAKATPALIVSLRGETTSASVFAI